MTKINHSLPSILLVEVANPQDSSSKIVTSDSFCHCSCCLGGKKNSWCFLFHLLPRIFKIDFKGVSSLTQDTVDPSKHGFGYVAPLTYRCFIVSPLYSWDSHLQIQRALDQKQCFLILSHGFSPAIHFQF